LRRASSGSAVMLHRRACRQLLSTLAGGSHPASAGLRHGPAAVQEQLQQAPAPSTPAARSFYKRQLPRDLIPFASQEVRALTRCTPQQRCACDAGRLTVLPHVRRRGSAYSETRWTTAVWRASSLLCSTSRRRASPLHARWARCVWCLMLAVSTQDSRGRAPGAGGQKRCVPALMVAVSLGSALPFE